MTSSDVFIFNFENISYLVFLLLTLNRLIKGKMKSVPIISVLNRIKEESVQRKKVLGEN